MLLTALLAAQIFTTVARAAEEPSKQPWVVCDGESGPGVGKHIVLVSGDEEYRSEEALPQLGKILAKRHGFKCTVLFAIDPETGLINPNVTTNIPGLEALDSADLMIIFTRFRALPPEQMQHIDAYLQSGKPVIGMRTATHAFNFKGDAPFRHYGNGYGGDMKDWADGFGRLVLGEKWISHHGSHKHESTRGLIAPQAKGHPVVRGIEDGDVWGPTDVYGVRLPLPGDSTPIVLGQVTLRKGEFDAEDPLYGMRPDDGPAVEGKKNDPLMPVAWTKTYQLPDGKQGRVFTSTMGASTDLLSEGTRRMFVNAVYWCLAMEDKLPEEGANVDLVGEYHPTAFAFRRGDYWPKRAMTVDEHRLD
ncbi:MAG: ThuA domain-containing protein [Pirellulaceae bacterium]